MNNNSDDVSVGRIILGIIVGLVVIIGLGVALGWINLFTQRPMAKYQEETRKEVYDTSRQAEQGMNRDIVQYCEQMRDKDRPLSSRKAVAALIRTDASTFDGNLTQDAKDCVTEAKDF